MSWQFNPFTGKLDKAGAAGGGAPGGSDTQLQFNDGGAFAGLAGLTINKTTGAFGIPGPTTLAAGTLASSVSALGIAVTWGGGGTHTGLLVDVTDDGSADGSNLLDMKVGGTSAISVSKSAICRTASGGKYLIHPSWETGLGGNFVQLWLLAQGSVLSAHDTNGVKFGPGATIGWCAGPPHINATDLVVGRAAPNTLALRNGANAQAFRVNGTHTDANNGRWLNVSMSTDGVASITPTGNGTGASGNVLHISGLPTSNPGPGILWNDAGTVKVGT